MRQFTAAPMIIAVSLALAACTGDRETTAPRSIATRPAQADFVLATLPPCDFTTLSQDAKNYFAAKDIAFTYISNMKTAFKTSALAATPSGFDVFGRIADVRRAGLQIGSAAAGGKVAMDVVACIDVGPVYTDFKPDLALAAGIFEVAGPASDAANTPSALAYIATPGVPASKASPLWGTEPTTTWARPAGTIADGRYLIYGYPQGTTPDVRNGGFELETLPFAASVAPSMNFRVGVCVSPTTAVGGNAAANLLVHNNTEILLLQGLALCSGNMFASLNTSSWFASLANRAGSLLAPHSLMAMVALTGSGGTPSGWDPFSLNQFQGANIALKFDVQPSDDFVNTDMVPTVVVRATQPIASGAMPPIVITLTITGNNGFPANIVNNTATTTTVTTTPDGLSYTATASFPHLQFTKAGGYTINANGSVGGSSVATQTVTSTLFNIQNKTP